MMDDRPDGAELLAVARTTLLEDLLPELPQARRYHALMIANAMAMARRELEIRPPVAEQDILAHLAAELRAGKRDRDQATYGALLEACIVRVRVSQPRAMAVLGRNEDEGSAKG
jgi:hypothetical protein